MRNLYSILKKEIGSYFISPIAYVVIGIFLIICGYFFYGAISFFSLLSLQASYDASMQAGINTTEGLFLPLFSNMSLIILLIIPLLTMRLFSEEKRLGTIEVLLTLPVRDGEVILGKFLACAGVFSLMLTLTFLYPLIVALWGELETAAVLTGYLGLFLIGIAFISLGLFFSSLTENQIVAAVASFGAFILFLTIGWSSEFVGPPLNKVLIHLSILNHFSNFAKGIIDTSDLIYYLNFIFLCLFLTSRVLESRRWRG